MSNPIPTPASPVLATWVEFVRNPSARSGVSPSFSVSYSPAGLSTQTKHSSKLLTDEECSRLIGMDAKTTLELADRWCDSVWDEIAHLLSEEGVFPGDYNHKFKMFRHQLRRWLRDEAERWDAARKAQGGAK